MPNKILTAALGAGRHIIESAYDIPALAKHLDLLHIMAYDYHGSWDGKTGSNAPLNTRDSQDYLSLVSDFANIIVYSTLINFYFSAVFNN